MRCLDATFLVDLATGTSETFAKSRELDSRPERLAIPAPVLTEIMVGAYPRGGKRLTQALELVAQFDILEVTGSIALDAARLGGECFRRGTPVGNFDLLIAAITRNHGRVLLTRDEGFNRVPGLTVEAY